METSPGRSFDGTCELTPKQPERKYQSDAEYDGHRCVSDSSGDGRYQADESPRRFSPDVVNEEKDHEQSKAPNYILTAKRNLALCGRLVYLLEGIARSEFQFAVRVFARIGFFRYGLNSLIGTKEHCPPFNQKL